MIFCLQKSCIDFAINATPLERYMPEERVGFKYRLWRIVESTPFEYFIMTLIVLNTILLMMKVNYISTFCTYYLSTISFYTNCISKNTKLGFTKFLRANKIRFQTDFYKKNLLVLPRTKGVWHSSSLHERCLYLHVRNWSNHETLYIWGSGKK